MRIKLPHSHTHIQEIIGGKPRGWGDDDPAEGD